MRAKVFEGQSLKNSLAPSAFSGGGGHKNPPQGRMTQYAPSTTSAHHAYSMGAAEWLLFALLSAVWGGSFYFYKVLVQELPTFTIVLARVAIAAAALHIYLRLMRDSVPLDAALWRNFFLMGLLNNVVPFALIVYGETHIASGLAAILNATTPVFTILAMRALLGEPIQWNKALGVALGLLGVVVLVGPQVLGGLGNGDLLGELAVVGAAVAYGFSGVVARRFRGVAPVKIAAGQLTASTFMLLPLALFLEKPWTLPFPSAPIWAALIALALLCTAAAYIMFFRLMSQSGPTNTSLVTLLVPVSAILLGSLFLGERLAPAAFLGMGIIALGLICIDGRVLARLKT